MPQLINLTIDTKVTTLEGIDIDSGANVDGALTGINNFGQGTVLTGGIRLYSSATAKANKKKPIKIEGLHEEDANTPRPRRGSNELVSFAIPISDMSEFATEVVGDPKEVNLTASSFAAFLVEFKKWLAGLIEGVETTNIN